MDFEEGLELLVSTQHLDGNSIVWLSINNQPIDAAAINGAVENYKGSVIFRGIERVLEDMDNPNGPISILFLKFKGKYRSLGLISGATIKDLNSCCRVHWRFDAMDHVDELAKAPGLVDLKDQREFKDGDRGTMVEHFSFEVDNEKTKVTPHGTGRLHLGKRNKHLTVRSGELQSKQASLVSMVLTEKGIEQLTEFNGVVLCHKNENKSLWPAKKSRLLGRLVDKRLFKNHVIDVDALMAYGNVSFNNECVNNEALVLTINIGLQIASSIEDDEQIEVFFPDLCKSGSTRPAVNGGLRYHLSTLANDVKVYFLGEMSYVQFHVEALDVVQEKGSAAAVSSWAPPVKPS